MSKKDNDMIVKYTLMPFNKDDDYEHFFSLSLRELAKNTKDKSLLAPLIVYNSELDVPMDNDLEEYTVYCNEDQILEVIKRQEINDVFRTLIIHGFDISMDDLKDIYIGIARRNNADLCINIIQDTGIDSNITLYIDSSIEQSEGKLWEMQKQEMYDEIDSFIDNYDNYETFDYTQEELESVENFLEALLGDCDMFPMSMKDKSEEKESKEEKQEAGLMSLSTKEPRQKSEEEHTISFSFENKDDVVRISCTDNDLFVIEENDYEVVLTKKQMEFIVECFYRITDIFEEEEDNEPR